MNQIYGIFMAIVIFAIFYFLTLKIGKKYINNSETLQYLAIFIGLFFSSVIVMPLIFTNVLDNIEKFNYNDDSQNQ